MSVHAFRVLFERFAESFITADEDVARNVRLKREHSLRVLDEITGLGESLELDDECRFLAQLAGLFHDIGRFEQYSRFRTFYDKVSVDHARLAIDTLNRETILDSLSESQKKTVLEAIGYHNRAFVPHINEARTALITRMLRDADKLDIFRVMIAHYESSHEKPNKAVEFNLPESDDISPQIVDDLHQRRLIQYDHIRNRNDFKLVQLGWVYDLNFAHSFRCVRDRGYLLSLRRHLPDTAIIDEVFRAARRYVEQRCGGGPEEIGHRDAESAE